MEVIRNRKIASSGVLVAMVVVGSFLLLTFPSKASAKTLVQTTASTSYTHSGASATLPGPVMAGDIVIVMIQAVVTGGITTSPVISDSSGTSFTQNGAQGYFFSGNSFWYLNFVDCGTLPTGGAESVSASFQNSGLRVEVVEVQGVTCQNPYSSSGTADNGTSLTTSTLVPFPTGGIAVASIVGNGAVTSGGAFTLLEGAAGDNFVSEYSLSAPSLTNFPATNGSPGQARYNGPFWLEVGVVYQPTAPSQVVTQTVTVTQTVAVIIPTTSTVTQTSTATQFIPTVSTITQVASTTIVSDPIALGFGSVIVVLLIVLVALFARRPPMPR